MTNELLLIKDQLRDILGQIDKLLPDKDLTTPLPEDILNGICAFYHTDIDTLRRPLKKIEYVRRKKITCYILYHHCHATQEKIADLLNLECHSTVLHHIKHVEDLLSNRIYGDDNMKRLYKQLLNHLKLNEKD